MLIWTKDGALGSGSLLKDSTILTNRHVVGNDRQVTVIFKPSDPSGKAKGDEVVLADVIKLDVQRDLALLRPASIPSRRPLDISTEDSIDVGTDVAAIGHPSGKTWTFTRELSAHSALPLNGREDLTIANTWRPSSRHRPQLIRVTLEDRFSQKMEKSSE